MAMNKRTSLALGALVLVGFCIGWLALAQRETPAGLVQPVPVAPEPEPSARVAALGPAPRDAIAASDEPTQADPVDANPTAPAQEAPAAEEASFVVIGRVNMGYAASQLALDGLLEVQVQGLTGQGHEIRAADRPIVASNGGFEVDASELLEPFLHSASPITSVRVSVHAGAGALAEALVARSEVICDERDGRQPACRLTVELAIEDRADRCFVTGRVVDEQGQAVPQATIGLLRAGSPPELVVETLSAARGTFLLRTAADASPYLLLVAAEGFVLLEQEIGAIAADGMHLGELVLERGHCLRGFVRMGALEHVDMPVRLSLSSLDLPRTELHSFQGFQRLRLWWSPSGFLPSGWHGKTKEDRSFEFCGLRAGLYRVHLSSLERQSKVGHDTSYADVVVPGGPVSLELTLPTVIVRVTDEQGAHLEGAQLELSCKTMTTRNYTDQVGIAYIAGPARAGCTIAASLNGYETARASFDMPAVGAIKELELKLKKLVGGATLKMIVEDERGALIEDWFGVTLQPDSSIADAQLVETAAQNSGDAQFIRDLRPGRWHVSVRGGGVHDITSFHGIARSTVELVSDRTTELHVKLPLEGRWRMRVRDENGNALACKLELERRESGATRGERVRVSFQHSDLDTNIFYSEKSAPYHAEVRALPPPFWDAFETLAPGLYVVRVEANGHQPLVHEFEMRADETTDVDLVLVAE